ELLGDRQTGTVSDLHDARAGNIFIHAVTQLEISSTAVRSMIRADGDPRFLMPDGVRDVIEKSGCYRDTPEPSEATDE
ncbi:MAG: nicotinic acid mononucleotide adenylyltransferase, partial [Pseudomonadota bacterium]